MCVGIRSGNKGVDSHGTGSCCHPRRSQGCQQRCVHRSWSGIYNFKLHKHMRYHRRDTTFLQLYLNKVQKCFHAQDLGSSLKYSRPHTHHCSPRPASMRLRIPSSPRIFSSSVQRHHKCNPVSWRNVTREHQLWAREVSVQRLTLSLFFALKCDILHGVLIWHRCTLHKTFFGNLHPFVSS